MDPERALIADPLYEVEEDNDKDLAAEASIKYDLLTVINSLGKDDFKNTYLVAIDSIKSYPLEIQQDFCNELLRKIRDIYNFEFPVKLQLDENSILDLYKFIEFIEFDYISFLTKLWRMVQPNLRDLDVSTFCENNSNLLIKEVDEIIKINSFSALVSTFLRTYTKEDLIKFIVKKTVKDRMLIFLEIKEGEEKNG